ncbi:amino acid transporter AVT1D-like [Portunus trituberculatus]|nr:amino acid transporter AVT1D-like [Portunus trituberculatus]
MMGAAEDGKTVIVTDVGTGVGVMGGRGGLSMIMAALLLVAQMAGAGFLSLPKALSNSGWIGVMMMLVFCVTVGFSGTRLGECWVMMEERWPQLYAGNSRQPYMDIAGVALGSPGRILAMFSVFATLFGVSTVFLVLISSFMHDLLPVLSECEWLLVAGAFVLPFTWLGTPKDLWQASVVAAASTALACLVIFVELLVEAPDYPEPHYPNPTVFTFALGFASILFAFGGASVFPTIQNDMADRALFGRSVALAFLGLLIIYLPVTVAGYAVMGAVESNILLNVDTRKTVIKVAIVMEVLNLIGTYIITTNPIFQLFEEKLDVENRFGWRRCVLRSGVVAVQLLIGLAVPSFDMIVNLVGGTTVPICSFILPGIMYLRMVDMKGDWKKRFVPLWERTLLILIVSVGVVGSLVSTATSIMDIANPDNIGKSCFIHFST